MLPDRSRMMLLMIAALLFAGCAQVDDGTTANGEDVEALTMTPGSTAATLVEGEISPDAGNVSASTVDDAGLDVELDTFTADEEGNVAGWATVTATGDDEGVHEVLVELEAGDQVVERSIVVTIENPEDPLQENDQAALTFTIVTDEGSIAFTNHETTATSPVPKAEGYQEAQEFDPFEVPLSAQAQLPPTLMEGLMGLGANYSVNADVPDAFGPEKNEMPEPREETVPRTLELPIDQEFPRGQAEQFGLIPPDAEEGDVVDMPNMDDPDPSSMFPYEITELAEETVYFHLALDEGETLTLHEPWPDATNVTHKGEEQATLKTTPPQGEGDTITWVEDWGETTEIVSITSEEIVLRHNPEIGLEYTQMNPQSGQATTITVADVTEEQVILEQDNPHPLGGETLTFIVTVNEKMQAPPPPEGQPQPGAP